MRPITATELLDLWELVVHNDSSLSPLDQSAVFLLRAFPELNRETLETLTIGQRESRLLQLRRRLFGPHLDGLANCPQCDQVVEFSLEMPADDPPAADYRQVAVDAYQITIRPLTAGDLRSTAAGDPPLWRRVVVEAKANGEPIGITEVPESIEKEITLALQEADPLADILLDLNCPACEFQWQEPLDPTSYFVAELGQWANETLYTIAQLAGIYHWSEADILAMSAWRRAYYLELAGR